eukprot:1802621-Amphidinium_carterae.2
MNLLSDVWRVMQKLGKQHRRLPASAKLELIHCLGVMPLLSCYLRSHLDERLTVSDASETGGGVCVSTGLTERGMEAWRRGDVLRVEFAFHVALATEPGGASLLEAQFVSCRVSSSWDEFDSHLSAALACAPHVCRVLVSSLAEGVVLERHVTAWRPRHPGLIWDLLQRGSGLFWETSWPMPQAVAKVNEVSMAESANSLERTMGLPKDFTLAILSKRDRGVFKTELEF